MKYDIGLTASDTDMLGKAYVHWKSWQETYAGLVDQDYLESLTLEKYLDIAKRWPDNVLVAKDREKVIGFSTYGDCRDGGFSGCGELYALYVLKEYQGRCVGYGLVNAALEKLHNAEKIVVWVLRSNKSAATFYQRYGFQFDGAEK